MEAQVLRLMVSGLGASEVAFSGSVEEMACEGIPGIRVNPARYKPRAVAGKEPPKIVHPCEVSSHAAFLFDLPIQSRLGA